ncbi:MAG: aspartate-semialdehyde dehydrogenase, partial [Phototrophicaceae bacterium]
MQKLNIAVLGATGAVGQRFIQLLEHHPWFQVTELIGSSRSAGKTYAESANWVLDGQPEARIAAMQVKGMDDPVDAPIIFSALPKDIAEKVEIPFAAAGHIVCTNASANRMVEDVPLLLAEVNHAHIRLVDIQRKNRGWS